MRNPTIVNIRGTSGSGKSTLVKAIFARCTNVEPVRAPSTAKRKQPLGYTMQYNSLGAENNPQKLFIAGHYESACGGCDTLGKYLPDVVTPRLIGDDTEPNSYHLTFGLVREYWRRGYNVVFEGLLISGDVRHTKALHDDALPINVVGFDLPVDFCIASVLERRKAAGNVKEFNEANTRDKHRLLVNCLSKLDVAGVPVQRCGTRELASDAVYALLGM
jgi:hypothetical protein